MKLSHVVVGVYGLAVLLFLIYGVWRVLRQFQSERQARAQRQAYERGDIFQKVDTKK